MEKLCIDILAVSLIMTDLATTFF